MGEHSSSGSSSRHHKHKHHRHRSHRDRSRDRDRSRNSRHRHHRRRSDDRRYRDRSRESERRRRDDKTEQVEEKKEADEESEEGEWVITADTGDLYDNNDEEDQPVVEPEELPGNKEAVDSSILNKLTASIMKAKMMNDTNKIKELEAEYRRLSGNGDKNDFSQKEKVTIIDKRFAPSRSAEEDEENQTHDPTIQEMLKEELETRGQGDWLDRQAAKQIGRDGGFENDLDYQADKAEELAKMTKDKEQNLRNRAIEKTRQLNTAIVDCSLCIDQEEGEQSKTAVIALGTRVYLCMAPEPSIAKGSSVIVPFDHKTNTLECDDDEWEEIRNFMKMLTQMWADQGKSVIFYESAANRSMRKHASIIAVPVPRHLGENASGFFSEAILSTDDEWSSHRKIIDTRKKAETAGKFAFRSSIAKEAPYFHVWFDINGGIGHIVENTSKWPSGDLFARDVLGGILQLDPALIRKRPHWGSRKHASYFQQLWNPYDWTKQIH